MSKFEVGDTVVIVGVTDLDGEFVEAGTQIIDPKHEMTMDWRDPARTLIGTVGIVTEATMNDYYDITVQFDWNAENEGLCFKEADAEKVTSYTVTGVIPQPMYDATKPVFLHEPGTYKNLKSKPNGEAGRKVSVTTESKWAADQLVSVFEKVYENVAVSYGSS